MCICVHEWILFLTHTHVHTHTQAFKFPSLALVSSWQSCRILDWRLSQLGFEPCFGNLACLITQKSSERTKQVCLRMTIYIYIYIYIILMVMSYIYIYIYPQFPLTSRSSLTFLSHPSLSSIVPGQSSRLHSVSEQYISLYSWANTNEPRWRNQLENVVSVIVFTFSSVLQMNWSSYSDICEIGVKWPYNCCFVRCCF